MPSRLTILCLSLLLPTSALHPESKSPADYPFRIHIFDHSEDNFYHGRVLEETKGKGRANLFANGAVHAVDFSFECPEKLNGSVAHETYRARWKRPNQELVVLLPDSSRTNTYFTCDLKTDVKDYAYTSHGGKLSTESSADYKAWMLKHDYDPEHGKNEPTQAQSH